MDPETLSILTNPEVIAVDQDPAGIQGRRITQQGPLEVWAKPLADRSQAVGLFNRTAAPVPMTADFNDLGLKDPVLVRDLWKRQDLGVFEEKFTTAVPGHGVVLFKAKLMERPD